MERQPRVNGIRLALGIVLSLLYAIGAGLVAGSYAASMLADLFYSPGSDAHQALRLGAWLVGVPLLTAGFYRVFRRIRRALGSVVAGLYFFLPDD